MSKHLADHRKPSEGGRVKHFLRIARTARETWHRPHTATTSRRIVEFLRIDRGRRA